METTYLFNFHTTIVQHTLDAFSMSKINLLTYELYIRQIKILTDSLTILPGSLNVKIRIEYDDTYTRK